MDIDASGNVYVTGSCDTSNTKHFLTLKYNSTGTLQWLKLYKSSPTYQSSGRSIRVGKSGKIYVTGDNYNTSTFNDLLTIKYNPATGDTIWTKRYSRASNSSEEAKVMALDANDNVYVSGMSYFGSYANIYTIKYDSLGAEKWVKTYSGTGGYTDIPKDIVCDNSGNVYVAGMSDYSYFGSYVTIKYNTLGDSLWTRKYEFSTSDFEAVSAMSLDNGGNIIVTGTVGNSGTDLGTVRYNSSGSQQWAVKFYGAQIIEDRANGIARDKNGNIYTVGKAKTGQGGDNIVIVKYDPLGVQKWVYNTGGTFAGYNAYDEGKAIAVDSNGFVYFTGTVYNYPNTKNDICTGKLDSNGNRLWHSVWVPTGPQHGDDIGNDIVVDTLGNVYITGQWTNTAGNLDFITIKYNSAGAEQWARGHGANPGGNDIANAITLDQNLNVFVTGFSDGAASGMDIATIKYSAASGLQQWVKLFNGARNGHDFGNDIGIDASGHVYVCGGTDTGALNSHAMLIKYLNSSGEQRWAKYRNGEVIRNYLLQFIDTQSFKDFDLCNGH
ncbi:MAG: SBBP repeat-containing protein [Ignavibacteria bacterium]|nr:SBBP repeat-containing protein [Ignavibacteria bacterium]